MTPSDDFFGASYMGDPNMQDKSDYLNQLASLHQMVTGAGSVGGTAAGGNTGIMPPRMGGMQSPMPYGGSPYIGPQARFFQTNNNTNTSRQMATGDPYTAGAPNTPPDTAHRTVGQPGLTYQTLGGYQGGQTDLSGTTIPPDIGNLRNMLTNYFANINPQNPSYTGSFQLPTPTGFNPAMSNFQQAPQQVQSMLGGLAGTQGIAQNIAQTGGAPTAQLLSSLNSIQNAGQDQIQRNLAQIREQYGAQGTGLGSDVNQALALGATTGQGQIEAQQSSLLTNVLQNAAQTQLGGVNANINSILGSAGLMNTSLQGAGQGLSGLAGLSNTSNMYTNNAQYQDFIRQYQTLNPSLQAAMGLATSYPGVNPVPSTGATLGAAGIGAGGSIGGTLLAIALGL